MSKSIYRFSPIKTEEEAIKAIEYIVQTTTALCEKVVSEKLPITYLTIFAHYESEYEELLNIFEGLGEKGVANNGFRFALREPVQVGNSSIQHVRVRKPDAERPQVGCVDFGVTNYSAFKGQYLSVHPDNLRLIVRPEYEMIEFFDPEFDVLAYVVSN